MKTNLKTRLLSLLLIALVLLPTMMPLMTVFAAEETTYVLNCGSLQAVTQGSKADGDTDTAGTDNFFTIHYSAKTKIDGSKKTFDDGFYVEQRINFGGKIDLSSTPKNCVSFTTQGAATVKIWWVCGGDGREFGIYDESHTLVAQTKDQKLQNELCISTLTLGSEGTYYLGGIEGNNYIFKIEVTTNALDKGPRDDWANVAAPSISSVTITEDGKLSVSINGLVDHNGADYLTVNLLKDGNVVSTAKSTSVKSEHTLSFSPVASGDYSIQATLTREGEEDKISEVYECSYKLPLEAPYITNMRNLGNGSVNVIWNAVREALSYDVTVVNANGSSTINTTERALVLENQPLGDLTIQITANGAAGSTAAEAESFTVKNEADMGWNYVIYGPSAKPSNNSYTVNEDGSITLSSTNNGGKLQPTGADGLGFYYTVIPADQNFTFRADIHVDSWVITNGQEGFGLMVTDHVPSTDYLETDFWTNQYQALCTKIEYRYAVDEEGEYYIYTTDTDIGNKYSMKLGIGTISKTGIDQSIIDRTALGETGLIVGQNGYLKTVVQSLERQAGFFNKEPGTYNIIGNWKGSAPEGSFDEANLTTDLTLEIVKNNTGYFITYYNTEGEIVRQIKNYEHDALEKFDSEYIYLGMFAARYATATFSNVTIDLIDEEDDLPAESRPIEIIIPTVTVTSSTTTTTTDYNLVVDTNVAGTLEIILNDNTVASNVAIKGYERFSQIFDIADIAQYDLPNTLVIKFNPDPDQTLPPYTQLSTTSTVIYEMELMLYKGNYHRKSIYVSPTGLYNGTGSKEHPYDIYTAIQRVVPGQTIVLMEGTYTLKEGIRIQRGMNGTEENPIRMIADPEAKTRPVLDFVHEGTGITHGGNWWYFYGFDVTNTLDSYKGFQVSGNNNVLDNIHTYRNGNTGIQISRYHVADLYKSQWPANNLILNCTSYGNADKGYEDADGFAAKLTIGEGNVFDGCVAYNNADDGWDLYAKVATGSIGSVVIRNCVAYGNGYLEDGTIAGNGNGFKLGGDSLSGYHQLINCIAFNNKQKGIDSNSCPDIQVENCISYNNGSYNVAFYTNSSANTDFSGNGIISFKDENVKVTHASLADPMVGDNLKPKGNQDVEKYVNSSSYYWHGQSSTNDAGTAITADMFVSLEFNGFSRNEDGSINMHGFLELNDNAPTGTGTTGASTPSAVVELVPDEPHNYSDEWTTTDYYIHWKECECGDKAHIGEHTFITVIDKEPTRTESGLSHQECSTCGYKVPQMQIPPLTEDADTTPPSIFEDFFGWFAWLWNEIIKFFLSLFGGKA